ncbi:uncharacterized protein LOC133180335 [Saccostrea echinata]|uniref:uncharacterized protein LOC133180335 n=1 Tax=Saccostrea echinata TaxID=191078 RepID=UPI002A7F4322|nr:uncharacterized protein LOC133180335 [Saccostrea echinata]
MDNFQDFDMESATLTPMNSTVPNDISVFGNEGIINVPHISEKPVRVYEMESGEEMAFPWLFPCEDDNFMGQVLENHIPSNDSIAGGLTNLLMVSVGARFMLMRNIKTENGLVNGAIGTIVNITFTNDKDKPSCIYVKFDDPKIGRSQESLDETVTVTLKVLKKSKELQSYFNKSSNKTMHFFNIIGGKGTEVYKIRIYQKARFDMIKEGMTFKFQNALKKTSTDLWITSKSVIAYAASVETSQEVDIPTLPENSPAQGEPKPLKDALQSPDKSQVTGKIFKVSPLKYRQEGSLAVKSIMIKDSTSVAKVCLFNKNVLSPFNVGDTVKVTNVYPKVFQTRKQLTTCPTSSCEFVADNNVQLGEEDMDCANLDPDFSEELENTMPEEIVLTDFTDVDVYICCDNAACRQKKYVDRECPVCKRTSSIKKTFRVTFLFKKGEKQDLKTTVFKSMLDNILQEELKVDTKEELIHMLISRLPIRFKSCISANNTFYNITK